MKKYFFFTIIISLIGYFVWSHDFGSAPETVDLFTESEVFEIESMKKTGLNNTLGDQPGSANGPDRSVASDGDDQELKEILSDDEYMSAFEEQTPEERKRTITVLQKDIANRDNIIASLKASGEEEGIEKLEEVLRAKKAQLEYYQFNIPQSENEFE